MSIMWVIEIPEREEREDGTEKQLMGRIQLRERG